MPDGSEQQDGRARRGWVIALVGALAVAGVVGGLAVAMSRTDDDGPSAGAGEPRRGGTLRVAVVNLQSLDPAEARESAALMVADHLFDTLVVHDPETLDAAPGVAESWEASVDQRRFTFVLREGVTFHDGSPLTADDVKATLERIAAPGSDSELRFLLESVKGYPEFHADGKADTLAGVTAVDPRTVTIELVQPFSLFPLVLGNPGFGIVPAELAGSDALAETPVGSGPLTFDRRDGDVIRLVRTGGYRPQPTWIDALELHVVDDPEKGYGLLDDGKVDLAPVPANRVNAAASQFGEAGLGPFLANLYFGMNVAAPDLADPRMREAILHAVDVERIIGVVYGDTVDRLRGVVTPPVNPGDVNSCGERCEHDADQARDLLAQAFPDGNVPEITIDFADDPKERAVASAIGEDLESVGIPVALRPHAFKDYPPALADPAREMFRSGWIADYPSPDAFLFPLFVSGQRDNLTQLQVREIDQRLRTARAEPDPAKRVALYRDAEQAVLALSPVVPIAQFTNRWAAAPEVGGFAMSPLGTFAVTDVFLARGGGTSA